MTVSPLGDLENVGQHFVGWSTYFKEKLDTSICQGADVWFNLITTEATKRLNLITRALKLYKKTAGLKAPESDCLCLKTGSTTTTCDFG